MRGLKLHAVYGAPLYIHRRRVCRDQQRNADNRLPQRQMQYRSGRSGHCRDPHRNLCAPAATALTPTKRASGGQRGTRHRQQREYPCWLQRRVPHHAPFACSRPVAAKRKYGEPPCRYLQPDAQNLNPVSGVSPAAIGNRWRARATLAFAHRKTFFHPSASDSPSRVILLTCLCALRASPSAYKTGFSGVDADKIPPYTHVLKIS